MSANNVGSDQDYDEDLPDFSTPEWEEKWKNATFSPGEPLDLDSGRVRNFPDGTTVVSYDILPEDRRSAAARPIPPAPAGADAAHRPFPPTASTFEPSPLATTRAQGTKRSPG